jgi:Tfp pilus assembly protein PilZ
MPAAGSWPRLRLDLPGRGELLRRLLVDTLHGGLFVPSDEDRPTGQNVVLDLRLPGLPDGVQLAGVVRWRQPAHAASGSPSDRPSWWLAVEFLASEWRRRDFLIDLATGALQRRRIASRRIPARVDVILRVRREGEEEAVRGISRDVGRGGVFVGQLGPAMEQLQSGLLVGVELPAAPEPLRVAGRVAWQGADAEGAGLGVAFQFTSEADRHAVLGWVAALEDRIAQAG